MTIAKEQAAWFAETFSILAGNVEQAILVALVVAM